MIDGDSPQIKHALAGIHTTTDGRQHPRPRVGNIRPTDGLLPADVLPLVDEPSPTDRLPLIDALPPTDGLPPLPARAGSSSRSPGAPSVGDSASVVDLEADLVGELQRALERAEAVEAAVQRIRAQDDELDDMVCGLPKRLAELVDKHAKGDARLDRQVAHDSQRSEHTKRMHEELDEEFREFRAWNVLEPRFWIWRSLYKLGFYLSVILSFLFVVPFTALYSKTLRFFRNRRRRASSKPRRPAWTTGHGEVDPDFVSSDFFPEGGLARFNPLRLSSGSLELAPEHTPDSAVFCDDSTRLRAKERDDSDERVSDVTDFRAPTGNGASHHADKSSSRNSQKSDGLRSETQVSGAQSSNAHRRESHRNGARRPPSKRKGRPKSAKGTGRTPAHNEWGNTRDNGSSSRHRRAQSVGGPAEVEGGDEEREKKPSWAQHEKLDFSAIGRDSSTDFWASFGAEASTSSTKKH